MYTFVRIAARVLPRFRHTTGSTAKTVACTTKQTEDCFVEKFVYPSEIPSLAQLTVAS